MTMSSLHPNVTVDDANAAVEFYAAALGAELTAAITAGDAVIHADLRLTSEAGTSTFTVAAPFPPDSAAPVTGEPTSASFTLPVEDVDVAFARAVGAGATATTEPGDWFEGFRQAAVRCPFGHRWYFVHVADSVTTADIQRASDAWTSGAASEPAG